MLRLILLSLTLALASSSAQAAVKPKPKTKARWVTLVHATGNVPTSWSVALRTAAETADASRTWMPPPSLALEELQLTLGCATWGPACAGQAASLLGADKALTIDLTERGGAVVLAIGAVSRTGAVVGEVARAELSVDAGGQKLAEAWVAGAVRGTRPTMVTFTSDLPGTEVLIDGQPRGVTPLTLIDVLTPGAHVVLLRREGRAPLSKTINVAAGVLQREHLPLAAGPAMTSTPTVGEGPPTPLPMPAPSSDGGLPPMALVGFGLGGAGVVAGVVGVGLAAVSLAAYDEIILTTSDGKPGTRVGICDNGDGTFGAPGSCDVGMTGEQVRVSFTAIDSYRQSQLETANLGLVLAGAGLLVGATGVALGFGALTGEEQDAASGSPAPAAKP